MQSPYIAQVQLLRDRLYERPEAFGVEVSTIDSFQGREADAVIISMVESEIHQLPFFLLFSTKDSNNKTLCAFQFFSVWTCYHIYEYSSSMGPTLVTTHKALLQHNWSF